MILGFKTALGVVNGINTVFETGERYVAGTLQVWVGGFLLEPSGAQGWQELNSTSFQLTQAPIIGQVVRVYYRTQ